MDEMKVKIERAALAGLAAGSMLPADRSTDISMDELEALVETAGGDGGLIIATDHSFHEGMPEENVLYFLEKAREIGKF